MGFRFVRLGCVRRARVLVQTCLWSSSCPTPGLSIAGNCPQTGCGKTAFPNAYEVKALSQNHRFVIVLHSPDEVAETGLCMGPPEKNARKLARAIRRDYFSSP